MTTPKNATVCAAAGGVYTNAFTWGPGVWTPNANSNAFTRGTWVQRRFSTGVFAPAVFFARSRFAEDFYAIQGSQQARAADQTALCKNSQTLDLVLQLTCDCGTNASAQACFPRPPVQPQLLARACSNLTNSFAFPGSNQGSISVAPDAAITPSCVDLQISAVSYTTFELSRGTVYSSVFLQTLTRSPYGATTFLC